MYSMNNKKNKNKNKKRIVKSNLVNGLRCTADNRMKNSLKSTFKDHSSFLYVHAQCRKTEYRQFIRNTPFGHCK